MQYDFKYLDTDNHVELTDISLASCLVVLDFPIIAFNRDPKEFPKVGMVFKKTKKLEQTVQDYWDGNLLVEPKTFWNTSREIKSRIRSSK